MRHRSKPTKLVILMTLAIFFCQNIGLAEVSRDRDSSCLKPPTTFSPDEIVKSKGEGHKIKTALEVLEQMVKVCYEDDMPQPLAIAYISRYVKENTEVFIGIRALMEQEGYLFRVTLRNGEVRTIGYRAGQWVSEVTVAKAVVSLEDLQKEIHGGGGMGYEQTYPEELLARMEAEGISARETILDLGSGVGKVAEWVNRKGYCVLGLDINEEYLRQATDSARTQSLKIVEAPSPEGALDALRQAPDAAIAYQHADLIQGIPLPHNSVGAVVLHRTMSDLMDVPAGERLVREVFRVLKPGGMVSFLDFRFVKPAEEWGEWYSQQYDKSKLVIKELIARGHLSRDLERVLVNPRVHPSIIIFTPEGGKDANTANYDNPQDLVEDIIQGRVVLRFIVSHPEEGLAQELFRGTGFDILTPQEAHIARAPFPTWHLSGFVAQKTTEGLPGLTASSDYAQEAGGVAGGVGIDGRWYRDAQLDTTNIEDSNERLALLEEEIRKQVEAKGRLPLAGQDAVNAVTWLLGEITDTNKDHCFNCSHELFRANMPTHMREMPNTVRLFTDSPSPELLIASMLHDSDRFYEGYYVKRAPPRGSPAFNNYFRPIQHPRLAAGFARRLLGWLNVDRELIDRVCVLIENHELGIPQGGLDDDDRFTPAQKEALVRDSIYLRDADSISPFNPVLAVNWLRSFRGEDVQRKTYNAMAERYDRVLPETRARIDARMEGQRDAFQQTDDGRAIYTIFERVRSEAAARIAVREGPTASPATSAEFAKAKESSEQPKVESAGSQKKANVLLIASDVRDRTLLDKDRKMGIFVAPPFGLYRMKAYLEAKGVADVDVFDPNLYPEGMEEALSEMLESKRYDVVGFSPTHINMQGDMNIIKCVREHTEASASYERAPLLIAGGQEVTGDVADSHGQWLQNTPLDMVVLGYGESVLENIINVSRAKPEGSLERFDEVPGLAYFKEGVEHRVLTEPIGNDRFRELAFQYDPTSLIPYEEYWRQSGTFLSDRNLRARRATLKCVRLFTSSHCFNACGFCSSNPFLRHATGLPTPVYRLTAEEAVEIVKKNVEAHNPDAVFFNDDDFVIGDKSGRERVKEFCRRVKEEKRKGTIPERLKFYTQTKVRSIIKKDTSGRYVPETEMLDLMKEAGFELVAVGVETFSDSLLKAPSIDKKITSEMAEASIEGLFQAGITPLINLIFLPPETAEEDILVTVDKTVEYARRGAMVSMQPFIEVYPGAPMAKPEVLEGLHYQHIEVTPPSGPGTIEVATYLLPQDAKIRQMALAVEGEADEVLAKLAEAPSWNFEYPPQPVRALTYFMAALNRMGYSERVSDINGIIRGLVEVYNSNIENDADLPSPHLMEVRNLSLEDRERVGEVLASMGQEGTCRDIDSLIMMYEGRFFYDEELSDWVRRKYSETVLYAITTIIFRYTQLIKGFGFDPQIVEFLRRLSHSLARDYNSLEAERLLVLLNFNFGIKTDVLDDFMLADGTLVDIAPDDKMVVGEDAMVDEFRGKRVLVCEEHQDDAPLSLGNLIQEKIVPAAGTVTFVVTATSDPLGVTDEYAAAVMEERGIPLDGVNVDTVKKGIRENEGKRAAKAMGVDKYIPMKADYMPIEPVYNDEGRFMSYYTRWQPFGPQVLKRAIRLIEEEDPDCIMIGMPRVAYHQCHRDVPRLFLNAVAEVNKRRVLMGQDPIKIYFYASTTDRSLFDAYGIGPNMINPFDEDGLARKQEVIRFYESQLQRQPVYLDFVEASGRLYSSHLAQTTSAEYQYAEALLSVELVTQEGANLYSDMEAACVANSVDAIMDKLKEASAEGEKQLRLHILDRNVCYETRSDFGFVPQWASEEVSGLLSRLGVISIVIDMEGVDDIEGIRGHVRDLVQAVKAKDETALWGLVNESSGSPAKLEVFSEEDRGRLPEGTKAVTWKSAAAERFKDNSVVTVGIHQQHYFYYLGNLQKMNESDIFVMADNLQYVKNEWQNRMWFGVKGEWVTVPLLHGHLKDNIADKRILNVSNWRKKHRAQLERVLSHTPFYAEHAAFFEELYRRNWNNFSALSEAMTRYVAKKMGLKDALLIRASHAGEVPPGHKKGRYLAATVKRVAGDFVAKPSCKVVYVSGPGAHYLEELDEDSVLHKERLLSEGIAIEYNSYSADVVREVGGINPYSSGLEALCRLGPQAADILRHFGQGAKRKFVKESKEPKKISVGLIYPRSKHQRERPEKQPLELMYLASLLSSPSYLEHFVSLYPEYADEPIPEIEVQILDLQAEDEDFDLEGYLKGQNFDIVGVTALSPLIERADEICKSVKRTTPSALTVIGGHHVTALPKKTLRETGFDVGIVGPGGDALVELCFQRAREKPDYTEVKGTVLKTKEEGVHLNPARDRKIPLAHAPPAADSIALLNLDRYRSITNALSQKQIKGQLAMLFTATSCPFACNFCANLPAPVEERELEDVVAEMEFLYERGFKVFQFIDDTFSFDIKRTKRLCRLLKEKPWHTDIEWIVSTRVDRVDVETIRLMKEAGCAGIRVGVETGDPSLLKALRKGIKLSDVKRVRDICRQEDLPIGYFLMVGLPGQDWDSIKKTVDFVLETDPDAVSVAMYVPYPGSPWWGDPRVQPVGTTSWDDMRTSPEPHPDFRDELYSAHTKSDRLSSKDIGFARKLVTDIYNNRNKPTERDSLLQQLDAKVEAEASGASLPLFAGSPAAVHREIGDEFKAISEVSSTLKEKTKEEPDSDRIAESCALLNSAGLLVEKEHGAMKYKRAPDVSQKRHRLAGIYLDYLFTHTNPKNKTNMQRYYQGTASERLIAGLDAIRAGDYRKTIPEKQAGRAAEPQRPWSEEEVNSLYDQDAEVASHIVPHLGGKRYVVRVDPKNRKAAAEFKKIMQKQKVDIQVIPEEGLGDAYVFKCLDEDGGIIGGAAIQVAADENALDRTFAVLTLGLAAATVPTALNDRSDFEELIQWINAQYRLLDLLGENLIEDEAMPEEIVEILYRHPIVIVLPPAIKPQRLHKELELELQAEVLRRKFA